MPVLRSVTAAFATPHRTPRPWVAAAVLIALAGCSGASSDGDSVGNGDAGEGGTDGATGGDPSASGLRLRQIEFSNADGGSSSITFDWDAQGRLLGATERDGGDVTRTRRYLWPDAVRFTEREDDVGGDGSVDARQRYAYTPDGQLGGISIEDAAGMPVGQIDYSVGDDGLVDSLARESSGVLVRRETYEYTGADLSSVLIDSDGDGVADQVLGYSYVDDGSVAGTTRSELDGGAVLSTGVWTYERGECIRGWMNSTFHNYCVTFL